MISDGSRALVIVIAACVFAAACDKVPGAEDAYDSAAVKALSQRVEALDKRVADLDDLLRKTRVDAMKTSFNVHHLTDSAATLDTSSKSYGIARNKHGPFYLSVEKVEPFLSGYKLHVVIGNPTNLTFKGAEFEVSWGLSFDADGKSVDDIIKSQHTKSISSTSSFPPGTYTMVELVLNPATAEEIATIDVKVNLNEMSMRSSIAAK